MNAVEDKIPVDNLVEETDYDTKITETEKKAYWYWKKSLLIMINILVHKIQYLAPRFFSARLAQANVIRKTDFDDELKSLNQKSNSNKQNIYLLKMNWTNYKHLIQFILEGKVIFKRWYTKII